MAEHKTAYQQLLNRLDRFIRKYYTNELIRGGLIFSALVLGVFLTLAIAEYVFWFSPLVRKLFFYSFLAAGAFTLYQWIIRPLFKLNKLGKRISHEQAATIIGKHFPEVSDKLLNILQLRKTHADTSLIEAGINQKSEEIKPVPFQRAVDFTGNKKYAKYVLPPLLVFLFLMIAAPAVLSEGGSRLVQNNKQFEKPAPFQFIVENQSLQGVQHSDFNLRVRVEGDKLPSEIRLHRGSYPKALTPLGDGLYETTLTNLQEDVTFYLEGGGYQSAKYTIDVKAKPGIQNVEIQLNYPAYLGMEPKVINGSGDLEVPAGTRATWLIQVENTERASFQTPDTTLAFTNKSKNEITTSKILTNNELYKIILTNKAGDLSDTSTHSIQVNQDAFPTIQVSEFQDSLRPGSFYYIGKVSDDYGLSALTFFYTIQRADSVGKVDKGNMPVAFNSGSTVADFTHFWDKSEFALKPGDRLSGYFQVWDNDGFNGRKSARSQRFAFAIASKDSLQRESEQEFDDIQKDLEKTLSESKEIQKEIEDLKADLIDKKEMSWEDKKRMEELLRRQESFEKSLESLNERLDRNMQNQSEFKQVSEEIRKKQEAVQKLFDDVLDEETKAMFDKLEEMLEELNKEQAMEQLEATEMDDETLEEELDRMMELLERLEFEQKMQETVEELKKLAEEQEKLAEEASQEKKPSEELAEKQEELQEEFNKLQEKLDELNKEGKEDLSDVQEKGEEANESMEQAQDEMGKSPSESSDEMKDASQKMQEMAQSMQSMMQQNSMEQMEEDMQALRQLLENLVALSIDQEHLMDAFNSTSINTPQYVELVRKQYKLLNDSEMVEDSLYALASRVFQIEAFITEEIQEINFNHEKGVDLLEERKYRKAVVHQQYAMTGYNNLALMLSEVMQQMQQQMAQQQPGDQMCENPGNNPGSKPGKKMSTLKSLQKQLNDQMQKMGEMKEKGSSPGGKKGMSEEFAKMAAKQQAIRQKLQEMSKQQDEEGNGSGTKLQEAIEQMEQTEEDLVNKRLTEEMLKRQEEIMTRLLEAEDAERQRDEKKERKSNTGTQVVRTAPPSLEEFLKKQESIKDPYNSEQPTFTPFYKNLSDRYFNVVNQ